MIAIAEEGEQSEAASLPIVRTNSWEIELNKIDPIRGFHRTNRRNREGGLKKGGGIGEGDKRKYERAQYRGKNVKQERERRVGRHRKRVKK